MTFRFEKLRVWQQARSFVKIVYMATAKFPDSERYGLRDQIRRASVSIVLNIAEGSDRKSDIEFVRYLRVAIGSVEEVVAAIYISLDLSFLSRDDFDSLYDEANNLAARLNATITSLKRK